MVSDIPKDHKGLYTCEPFNHGVQQDIRDIKMEVKEDGGEKKQYKNPVIYLRKSKAGNHLYAFNVEKEDGNGVLGGKVESLLVNISDVQAVIDGKMDWAKVSVLSAEEEGKGGEK